MADPDPVLATLVGDVEELKARLEDRDRSAQQLWAVIDLLIDVLEHKGVVNEGHRRLIRKLRERSPALRAKVRLRAVEDKYAVEGPEIDCASRLHLCHARCCALAVELSRQDLEEGQLKWDIDEPYLLLRADDSYCSYLDRQTGQCVVYERRPAMCRQFDCRKDDRVWIDFEGRVATPAPVGVEALELEGKRREE